VKKRADLQVLVESAAAIALTVVLHNLVPPIWEMPLGGKVTAASMVPLLIIAIRWGARAGVSAGAVYGVLDFILGGVAPVHPAQLVLDYPVAFGLLGLAGLLPRYPLLGTTVGLAGRFASHLLSGVIFFASYAPEGMNPWLYSALYNGTYLGPELVISLIVVGLVWWRIPGMKRAGAGAARRKADRPPRPGGGGARCAR
jgi:thiamine transporter